MKNITRQDRDESFRNTFWVNKQPPTVLIVEDHEDTRTMLSLLLRSYGFRVFEAEDGEQGLKVAERIKPDLILLDMRIPVLDGLTVTRLIRGHPTLNRVPIVAVTGNAFPQFEAEVLNAGCNYCLVKPLDFDRLEELLKMIIESAAPPRSAWKAEYPLVLRARAASYDNH
jgi:CheY-like chemotaxis protein